MGEGRGLFTHSGQVTARCMFAVLGLPVLQVSFKSVAVWDLSVEG